MSDTIFLSYARDDDEPFVKRLYEDLTSRGYTAWWDRVDMPSRALTFLQEIRDAVEGCDRLIAVIGPQAVASDYVRAEWEHAFLFCKGVIPVLRLGDYHLVPQDISVLDKLHCTDFRDTRPYEAALQELLDKLAVPVPPLGPLRNEVPALPPHFIPRREGLARLASVALADVQRPAVITAAGQTVTVIGMGGIGKSVLAAAFARAAETRRACTDGIVWIPVGQTPDLPQRIRMVAAAFDDNLTRYTDGDLARGQMTKLLADKVCLIVLDDVWELQHVEPFRNSLGPRCRLVVTTRDAGLATGLGAAEFRLDLLTAPQALKLLAEWADQEIASLPAEAHDVVLECGNLPLALAMIGAMVRGKPDRWGNVLHRLRSADLDKIRQQFPDYPYPDLLRAIQVSVDALKEPDRVRYLDLAVFPEETPIPEAALQSFWAPEGLDKYDTQDVIDRLIGLSLARRDDLGRLTLHDLQRDYVCRQSPELRGLHARLLKGYELRCAGGWASGPDDGYFFDHLAHHLAATDSYAEIGSLFADQKWMEARVATSGYVYFGYLSDLGIAWEMAASKVADDETYLADCFHYGLIRSSINSLAANYVPDLVVAAVQSGLWVPERALSIADKMPVTEQFRCFELLSRSDELSQEQRPRARKQALEAALAIADERTRVDALIVVAGQLGGEENAPALHRVLDAALAIEYEGNRARALTAMAEHLGGSLNVEALHKTLEAALAIQNEDDRAKALAAVAGQLSGEEKETVLHHALDATLLIESDRFRAEAMAAVAVHCSGDEKVAVLQQAVGAACAIDDEELRAEALAEVAEQLAGEENAPALHVILTAALAIGEEGYRWKALIAVARQLSGWEKAELLQKTLDAALAIKNKRWRAEALTAVAIHLSAAEKATVLQQALDAARASYGYQGEVLISVARHLCGEEKLAVLHQALDAALALEHVDSRGAALAAVATQFCGEEKGAVLDQALDAAFAMVNEIERPKVLATFAGQLSLKENTPVLYKALNAALEVSNMGEGWSQARVLAVLARQLNGGAKAAVFHQALDAAIAVRHELSRAMALVDVVEAAGQLRGVENAPALQRVLDAFLAMEDEGARAMALVAVAGQLTGAENAQALHQVLDAACAFKDNRLRAEALAAVVGQLSGEERGAALREALNSALGTQGEIPRAMALVAVAGQLSGKDDAPALKKVLDAARALTLKPWRAEALAAVAGQLGGAERDAVLYQALDDALAAEDWRETALVAVAGQLNGEDHAQALNMVQEAALAIEHEEERVLVLLAVAGRLRGERHARALHKALEAALATKDETSRATALVAVAAALSSEERHAAIPRAFDAARTINDERQRAGTVSALLPYTDLDRVSALQHSRGILHYLEHATRMDYLDHYFNLFKGLAVRPDTATRLAQSINDVCTIWRWL